MKRAAIPFVLAVSLAIAIAACGGAHPDAIAPATAPPRLANLHAFARLYGVVRWFHPSDAAAAVDWNRFAIDGARRVIDAPDPRALEDALASVFAPVAPTVRIAGPGEQLADDPALHPGKTDGLDLIAWEHLGYGDSTIVTEYHSKRRHRPRLESVSGDAFASVAQSVPAEPYRGHRVRLRAKLRAAPGSGAEIWMRVDRPSGIGFFDNMMNRPVTSTTWTGAELVGTVDADAQKIVFGALETNDGAWYDDFTLEVEATPNAWQPIAIADPGFESIDPMTSWRAGTGGTGTHGLTGWTAAADRDHPSGGVASLHVARQTHEVDDELFDDEPRPGETVDVELGAGLRARVPIALYSKDGRTIGDDPAAARASQAAPAPAPSGGYDPIAGAADVIVAWNVLEHFWPYFGDVHVDWMAELDTALADALDDRTADDHVATLERLAAAAPDGHADVQCPTATLMGTPAIDLDWIEDRAVVVASTDDRVHAGDVVTAIDGRATADVLAAVEARISGSPQWKRVIAMHDLAQGANGSTVTLRIHRDGAPDADVALVRGLREQFGTLPVHPALEELPGHVWYVDLSKVELADLQAKLPTLAAAPGVVFDLRGYPNQSGIAVIGLLIASPEHAKWMHVAHVIRPDHVAPPAWSDLGWDAAPTPPHLAGKIAFLTGPGAISYAESVMGYVDAEHLGAIVGAPTAGTNGNVAQIAEPSGCTEIFTGMRVTRHDGGRHHLIGVQPTVPATRTIAGVRAGKDEVLDTALESVIVK